MKRIFVSILIISSLLLSGQAKAQNPYYKQVHPNDISVSYGFSLLSTFGSVAITWMSSSSMSFGYR